MVLEIKQKQGKQLESHCQKHFVVIPMLSIVFKKGEAISN